MASLTHLVLGILILQIYVHAAPSDVGKLEDIANVEIAEEPLDSTDVTPTETESNDDSTENPRQKRQFYNPFGFGFPPISKPFYPNNFNNRDSYENPGTFGVEDPLFQIHRRVQEIANIVRQPPPAPAPQIPIFVPVLFVPSLDCGCNPSDTNTPEPTTTDSTTQAPNVTNRFPEMKDEDQNGVVPGDNNGDNDDDYQGQDFSRPISFDPIRFNRPMARPPPPVDRGTVQDGAGNGQSPGASESDGNASPPPPQATQPPPPAPPSPPTTLNPFYNSPRQPPPYDFSYNGPPTLCDGAILQCCHQPFSQTQCFANQGCSYILNPCQRNRILAVIERFQSLYNNRNG